MRKATSSTMTASARRRYSGFALVARRAPTWAPATEPSSRRAARTISTALVVVAWTIVAIAVTNNVWNKEVPSHNLYASEWFIGWQDDVHGLQFTRDQVVRFDNAYIDS